MPDEDSLPTPPRSTCADATLLGPEQVVMCENCDSVEPMRLDEIVVFHGNRRGLYQTEYDDNGRVVTFGRNAGTNEFVRVRFVCWTCFASHDLRVIGDDEHGTFLSWD
jgi:hypothetical protein